MILKALTFEEKIIFFFKMDEAWPNALSLEMDARFLEILIFYFYFFGKMMMMISFFKTTEAWPNASLQIEA